MIVGRVQRHPVSRVWKGVLAGGGLKLVQPALPCANHIVSRSDSDVGC